MNLLNLFILFGACVALGSCSDITAAVFGKEVYGMPAAFGDFNSDELTDVFVVKNRTTVQILFASVEEPLLQPKQGYSCDFNQLITSVVPGDFDGDVFMDILVTTFNRVTGFTEVYILWGGDQQLDCNDATKRILELSGQPLAMDYNQDMIIDLFGADKKNETRKFWVFKEDRSLPTEIEMTSPTQSPLKPIDTPHSNAFLDLNNDFYADLVVTTKGAFEVWHGKAKGFEFSHSIMVNSEKIPNMASYGQSLHLDVESLGKMDLILPVCEDAACDTASIYIYLDGNWENMNVNFIDNSNTKWGFAKSSGKPYIDTITMRAGDFNMDGYPDLLATLKSGSITRSFLLENIPCEGKKLTRTFKVRWNALNPFTDESFMAAFYDFYQDGILDVIFVLKENTVFKTAAFKNSLDYDANFVKVMVLTGRTNSSYPISPGSLGKKKRTYGTNLPGPSVAYETVTQDGDFRKAVAAQLPQSAHFVLNLPFVIFGLGRTPNFIDKLTIGLSHQHREWHLIIPNSQMVVIPNPPDDSSRWKAQLFVTPSKLILQSAAALTGTCGLIALIIGALYWKERREDKIEKLQEAHRFHFDAM